MDGMKGTGGEEMLQGLWAFSFGNAPLIPSGFKNISKTNFRGGD